MIDRFRHNELEVCRASDTIISVYHDTRTPKGKYEGYGNTVTIEPYATFKCGEWCTER